MSNIVGGPEAWNRGWGMLAGRTLDVEKLEVSAVAFGFAQAALDEAWTYAQEREQFGRPIAEHQTVGHTLVEARTRLEACRHILYHAARLATELKPQLYPASLARRTVVASNEPWG